MHEIHDLLQRMWELAVQASNGIYQGIDREKVDAEYQALMAEIDFTVQHANYNRVKLLDGKFVEKRGIHDISSIAESKHILSGESRKHHLKRTSGTCDSDCAGGYFHRTDDRRTDATIRRCDV